jgi:hypothetical protein
MFQAANSFEAESGLARSLLRRTARTALSAAILVIRWASVCYWAIGRDHELAFLVRLGPRGE